MALISIFVGFIKDIKSVMNEAKEDGLQTADGHKASSFFLPSYESDTKALTLSEIDKIHELDHFWKFIYNHHFISLYCHLYSRIKVPEGLY